MAIGFKIDLSGDKELLAGLARMSEGVVKMDDEFAEAGKFLVEFETKQVFETEGQIFSSPWQELSTPYKYRKARKFTNKGILEASGEMRKGFRFSILNTQAALFHNEFDDKYLKFHQSGTSKMPKRVLYKLNNELKNTIRSIFLDGIKKRLNLAFHV